MPRRMPQSKASAATHTHLEIRVTGYDAYVSAAVNHDVYAPQSAVTLDEDDPLYAFTSRLTLTGTATWPRDRDGHTYQLTFSGNDAPSREHNLRLRDVQARGKNGAPRYRRYRGREVPVYDPPKCIGFLDKVRDEARWTGWIFVATRFVRDALILLRHGPAPLYIALHEYRESRTRWIRGLTLQTADPAEE